MITGHLPELMIVFVLGLIFFGPKRLPEIGEAMGKSIRSFKTGISHIGDGDAPANNVHVPAITPTEPVAVPAESAHTASSAEMHTTAH